MPEGVGYGKKGKLSEVLASKKGQETAEAAKGKMKKKGKKDFAMLAAKQRGKMVAAS